FGNGRLEHFTWESVERGVQQRFLPDTISSDLTVAGRTDRVYDFPTVLSKFLLLGLTLDEVIARATINAARVIPAFKELGTLKPGAVADVAVFDLKEGAVEFLDNVNGKRIGRTPVIVCSPPGIALSSLLRWVRLPPLFDPRVAVLWAEFLGRGGRRATALSRQFPQASPRPVHHLQASGSLYCSSRGSGL